MKAGKTWLILGATDGLGPAAVRYLRAKGQQVIELNTMKDVKKIATLVRRDHRHPRLDYIINNLNYHLLAGTQPNIPASVESTVGCLKLFTPLLNKDPAGSIINIPPQLCLASLAKFAAPEYLNLQKKFLKALHLELQNLNCSLHFIEPGERFMQF